MLPAVCATAAHTVAPARPVPAAVVLVQVAEVRVQVVKMAVIEVLRNTMRKGHDLRSHEL